MAAHFGGERWRLVFALGLAALLCVAIGSQPGVADEPAATKPDSKQLTGRILITRADLAAALLRIERAYFAHPPQEPQRSEINKGFDAATLAFFTGRNAEAIRAIHRLADSLGSEPASPTDQALSSLKAIPSKSVWQAGQAADATVSITSIYELPLTEPLPLSVTLKLRSPMGDVVFERPLDIAFGPNRLAQTGTSFDIAGALLTPGIYRLEMTAGNTTLPAGNIQVVTGSLDAKREANAARLETLKPTDPAVINALASCKARNKLLSNAPSEENSAQFMADLNALSIDVVAEIDAIAVGKNPYARRIGDTWRVLATGKGDILLRVYAPPVAKDQPMPLLIVLHGAGGDENMFLEAYGAGLIKKIADKHGLLIASPLTYRYGGSPERIKQTIDALSHDYAIDRSRVYLLGHSMGAAATASLARGAGDTLAAACCIAGGNSFASQSNRATPTLVIVPELDAVVPPQGVKVAAEKAAAAGLPVELRMMPGFGHTLSVGAVLENAVDWLLKHRLEPPTN